MTREDHRLRVVAATPISEELIEMVVAREPRIDFIRDQQLLPPMRFAGDHSGDPAFERTPDQQARFESLIDSAEVLYGLPDESATALKRAADANPALRWVQGMPAGVGGQVKNAGFTEEQLARVAVTSSAGVHVGPLAEFAVFGLLAGAKTLPRLQQQQREHRWTGRWNMKHLGQQTILVVGLGSIGRETARKLKALGATVIGTSRHDDPVENVDEIVRTDDLAEVVTRVDGIVVTLPGTAATEKMIDARVLANVVPGTTLVNVGRGTVIDEEALVVALDDGRIGFAALDVFASEPLAEESPLWDSPHVLVSPHTAAVNSEEDRLIAELFAENARRYLDGEDLINRVDTVEFY